MLDLFLVLLLVLLFYGVKFKQPLNTFYSEEYLSINTSKYYRGLFAIIVVFHHLAQNTETGVLFRYFARIGFLAVAVFFFLSGYGLQRQYITKSEEYRKGFLLKRIPNIFIPYIIITVIYWLVYMLRGKVYSIETILVSILKGSPIVSNSWYIICILCFYVIYWMIMMICRNQYKWMIVLGGVWYFFYTYFCINMKYGNWWYNTSLLLVVGMFWATYEKKLLHIMTEHYWVVAPITWIVFVILFHYKNHIATVINIPFFPLVLTLVSSILFVLCIIAFSLKVLVGNKVLGFLGDVSLEIYVSHGLFMTTLRSNCIYINNEVLYCLAVLVCTLSFSILLHFVFQYALKIYRYLLQVVSRNRF